MDEESRLYKVKFNKVLQPIKVMLVSKRDKLPHQDWLKFVDLTKNSILNHPDEYIGREPIPFKILHLVIEDIFEEFIRIEINK